MFIAKIEPSIIIHFENEIGGYEKVVVYGTLVHIETKNGNSVSGCLVGYEESTDDLMPDILIVWTQDEKTPSKKVGVNSIVKLEVM